MERNKHNDIRCPVCLSEWNLADIVAQGYKDCPQCHTPLAPMKINEDGYVKLNWQDIRVLAQYARRWTVFFNPALRSDMDAKTAFNHIIAKLEAARPKDSQELFPQNEVIQINKMPMLMPKPPDPTIPINLTPDATGNIPSPFVRKIN